jgi:hypothetical protein
MSPYNPEKVHEFIDQGRPERCACEEAGMLITSLTTEVIENDLPPRRARMSARLFFRSNCLTGCVDGHCGFEGLQGRTFAEESKCITDYLKAYAADSAPEA